MSWRVSLGYGFCGSRSAKALEIVSKSRSTQRPRSPQRRKTQGFLSVLCELCVQTSYFFTGSKGLRDQTSAVSLVPGVSLCGARSVVARCLGAQLLDALLDPLGQLALVLQCAQHVAGFLQHELELRHFLADVID